MSPITKVFVVLLVLASLLQTAGTIVFINKIQPLQAQLATAKAAAQTAEAAREASDSARNRTQAQIATAIAQAEGERTAAVGVIGNLQKAVTSAEVHAAQLTAQIAQRDTENATLAQSVNMAQATNATQTAQISTLRDTNDKLVKQQEDDSRKIAELTNLSETEKSQLDNAQEQLAASTTTVEKLKKYIVEKTGSPAPTDIPNALTFGATPINGLIREKKEINGSTYVTISVGAADGVEKGMRFNVIDNQSGDFLGFVTVDTVDNNDAIGRVEGAPDSINRMQPGNQVKTQIRGS